MVSAINTGHSKLNSWKGEFIMTNTKKKNKNKAKLLSAVGMLTVSAAMLVSSTFAWFSMNKRVTAQTMSISAKSADPIIEISANGDTFANNLTTGTNWTLPAAKKQNGDDVKLKLVTPTAISGENAVSWGWASSSNHADAEKDKNTTAVDLAAVSDPAKTESDRAAYLGDANDLYVLKQKLTIRNVSVDVAATNLVIESVNIDKGTNTIGNAVRVLFVSGGKYAIYEPGASGTAAVASTPKWLTSANSEAMTTGTNGPVVAATLAAKGKATAPADGSSVDVDVYVFFDGTDDDAYTDKATDLSQVSIDFSFKID